MPSSPPFALRAAILAAAIHPALPPPTITILLTGLASRLALSGIRTIPPSMASNRDLLAYPWRADRDWL
jgi:hypothetical protein